MCICVFVVVKGFKCKCDVVFIKASRKSSSTLYRPLLFCYDSFTFSSSSHPPPPPPHTTTTTITLLILQLLLQHTSISGRYSFLSILLHLLYYSSSFLFICLLVVPIFCFLYNNEELTGNIRLHDVVKEGKTQKKK